MKKKHKTDWIIRLMEDPAEMLAAEELQRVVWPGSETDVIPLHLLVTAAHNGGIVIGAYPKESHSTIREQQSPMDSEPLAGFVFGFPGLYFTPDGPRPKHCSQQLAVHPKHRSQGLGFLLKRAQWQMVRHQGLDLITWTFDPLLSRNAYLNIARLGAVCNSYIRQAYGNMQDELNVGLPSDRFQVDWWVNSQRVISRLSNQARRQLDLTHYLAAGAEIINPSKVGIDQWLHPTQPLLPNTSPEPSADVPLLLVEIPSDFQALRARDLSLALEWRMIIRNIFEELFARSYLVTDFIHLRGDIPRSYYVLSHGESTL
jgi:predicted GNAT superfamily acetyltransferase